MTRPLQDLNSSLTARIPPRLLGLLAFLLTTMTFLGYYQIRFGLNVAPAQSGDEPAYDSIGWELSQGHGYRRDFRNPEFREPYDLTGDAGRFLKPSKDDGIPDTTRPPLFPAILSLLDRLFGRQFWSVRLWNVTCLAVVCGLACQFVAVRFGTLPGMFVLPLFILLDVRTRLLGRSILTEATATLLVALLCLSLIKTVETSDRSPHSRINWFLSSSLLLILCLYTRSIMLAWVPLIVLFLAIAVFRSSRSNRLLNAGATMVIFTNIILIGYLPWAIRNMSVTGEFLPAGTQGATEMSAAYGDAAWDASGVWSNLETEGFFSHVDTQGLSPLQARVAKARYSRQMAREWMAAHPGKTIALFPLKVSQSFRPHNVSEGVILVLSIIGLYALGSVERNIFLTLIAACAVSIGLTWSVAGRFLVPLLFVWHATAAIGLWELVFRATGTSFRPSGDPPVSTTGPDAR